MQAEDSWLAFFVFVFFLFFFRNFLTETFSESFPMVRFEPGTFHSASERLNHSAIPEMGDPSLPTDYTLEGWLQWLTTTPE